MPEITRTSKTFTYKLADSYLAQTDSLGKTASWTYTGPRYLWIFADENTKKIIGAFHYTERDNGEEVPTPVGQIKIKVDAEQNPLIASLIHNEVDYGTLPQDEEVLPDGSVYASPNPIPPDHTYEITQITYDTQTGTFNTTGKWKQPHTTWDQLRDARNKNLAGTDIKILHAHTPELKTAWETYRQALRDLPSVFAGVDAWKVPFPQAPDEVIQTNTEPA
jgi:hypothetical protein